MRCLGRVISRHAGALFSMTAGSLIGLAMAIKMTHERVHQPIQEARRLLDSIGWALIQPQILATLGLFLRRLA